MTEVAERSTFTADDFIPASHWGKDHWSTLAYIDTVMTDVAGFQVGSDARMRSNRRNFRVMTAECPRPRRATHRSAEVVMDLEHGSRLRDGFVVKNHDDWGCVQDMAEAGLFTVGPADVQPKETLHLSRKGQHWVAELRKHKQAGGSFSEFSADHLPEMPECKPVVREVFRWMNTDFDITGIRDAIRGGSLKPKRIEFDKDTIANYCSQVLKIDRTNRVTDQRGSFFGFVSSLAALAMPEAAAAEPSILAYVGKNKGILNMDGTGAHYALIDGNHRMTRAYFAELESREVFILTQAQVRPFKR
ncbi:hypothetical protein [Burkholderia cenocepacia]|uniref:hypothetical protein n=1 Tax=Burkholderia cenocepacia TaxID=95486 RepID=UPI00076D8402|nr:hypothetical protein [Burkholderia cenocepacia]KWU17954.1 hypothetical protein AS149_14870 [Burkholderia cenocepacia]